MFEKANIEIYELDLSCDTITASNPNQGGDDNTEALGMDVPTP